MRNFNQGIAAAASSIALFAGTTAFIAPKAKAQVQVT